jgi:hypothetical protein
MLTTIDEEKISNILRTPVSFISHVTCFQKTLLCIRGAGPFSKIGESEVQPKCISYQNDSESFSVGLNNSFFNLCSAFASINLEHESVSENFSNDFQPIDFCTTALSVLKLSY